MPEAALDTMPDLVHTIQARVPPGPRWALQAPGRAGLDYQELWRRTGALADLLAGQGLRRGDAVALALPDGPEQLVTLLAATRVAVAAPLDPGLREEEYRFLLADLRARALVVQGAAAPGAVAAARALGLQVLRVEADPAGPAGAMRCEAPAPAGPGAEPGYPAGTALLLHTSATTGPPKLVPLTHGQLLAMVEALGRGFPDYEAGRCLMITPQFHLHGLLSMVAELYHGGEVICTGGYRPQRFLDWMRAYAPTTYTATPTLHRAILALNRADGDEALFRGLRFVTSLGAPVPPELQAEFQGRLGVAVVDGYGMTEAGTIAQTPLDPAWRKPGSVGVVVGPELRIADDRGAPLAPGQTGEILIRGPMVCSGYAHAPEANLAAFRDGWFRTCDLGHLDAEGALYLTGRLKEQINRGGEKIPPGEVEAVLARHPLVQEVAVFGFPHPRLGEDVAAAVVLRPGAVADAQALRRYALESLAASKVPRRIRFLDQIPKGRTGKYQRAGLAALLGLAAPLRAPAGAGLEGLDAEVAALWARLLNVPDVGLDDDFFALGGDSLLAMGMLLDVQEAWGFRPGLGNLARDGTLRGFLAALRQARTEGGVVPLHPGGPGPRLFLVHGLLAYRGLAAHLGGRAPLHALDNPWSQGGALPERLEDMAAVYLADLRAFQPHGPYLLGGHSLGGLIAHAMARQLLAQGEAVTGLLLLDTEPIIWQSSAWLLRTWMRTQFVAKRLESRVRHLRDRLLSRWSATARRRRASRGLPTPYTRGIVRVALRYDPVPLPVPLLLLCCQGERAARRARMRKAWAALALGPFTVREVPGRHGTFLRTPALAAEAILAFLEGLPQS